MTVPIYQVREAKMIVPREYEPGSDSQNTGWLHMK